VPINWLSVFAIHRWSLENRLLGYHCINNIPPYSFPPLNCGSAKPFFFISWQSPNRYQIIYLLFSNPVVVVGRGIYLNCKTITYIDFTQAEGGSQRKNTTCMNHNTNQEISGLT
jgi:hypothetical protein